MLGVNGALDFGPLAGDQPGGEGTGKVRSNASPLAVIAVLWQSLACARGAHQTLCDALSALPHVRTVRLNGVELSTALVKSLCDGWKSNPAIREVELVATGKDGGGMSDEAVAEVEALVQHKDRLRKVCGVSEVKLFPRILNSSRLESPENICCDGIEPSSL